MDQYVEDSEHSNEDQPSNFLVLASQSETQYSQWDQQHMLQSLPALKSSQTPDKGKAEGLVEQASKSEDEKQKLPASVFVAATESEMSHEDVNPTDIDRVEDSHSEEESDSAGDVTMVKKVEGIIEERSDSPIYESQDEDIAARKASGSRQNLQKLFPSPLSQDEETDHQEHIVSTPSEHLGSLQLSCEPVRVVETVDESLDVLAPSPEAYGDIPVIIPSSPTAGEVEPDECTYNPDADRTLEAEDRQAKRHSLDRRERLPPPSNTDEPITEEDTNPDQLVTVDKVIEKEEDEVVLLDTNVRTLAGEETQGESLHLVYTVSQPADTRLPSQHTGTRLPSQSKVAGTDDQSKEDQEECCPDSQDLALHLSQSQGGSHTPTAQVSSQTKAASPPEKAEELGSRASQSKSASTSTDSNGFHLTLPKDGALIHPVQVPQSDKGEDKTSSPHQDEGDAVDAAVTAAPSLSIAALVSQSQSTEETTFRIQKPDLRMSEEGEEGSEVNVFKKTRSGVRRQVDRQLHLSDESEDFFNVELRGKRKSGPSAETKSPPTEKRARTGDITHIDQDAETQPDQSVSEKKPAHTQEKVNAPDPFDENTEIYEVDKSVDIEMVEDKVSSSLQEGSLLQLQTTPQGDGGASLRKEAEDQDTPLQHVQSQTVMQTDETSKPVASRGVTALSPKPSTSNRDLSEKEVSSRDLEKTRSSQSKEKEKQTVGKTAHVDSTSGSVADSKGGRLASVSLLKDSGIGDALNVTSVTETSPQAAPMVSLRRKSSDPYTFHGSQSQQMTTEQPITSRKPLPTTPLSSRKKPGRGLKRVCAKKVAKDDSSLSSDLKASASKPRPKKVRKPVTRIQKLPGRKTAIRDKPEDAPGDSGEPQVAVTSPGTGFEADVSHSLPSQRSTERHVAFQNIPGRPPSSASSAPGASADLSDSQMSDQLTETVIITRKKKTVEIETIVRILTNREGKVVGRVKKEEECGEPSFTTTFHSEETNVLPLVSPSRTASSLTPGDLADVSSGFSRSNSTGSKGSSLEKGMTSLDLAPLSRREDSFQRLLTSSSTRLSLPHSTFSSISSPSISRTEDAPKLNVARESNRTPVSDIVDEGRAVKTPDASVIEKTDSHIGAVVSSAGSRRTSDSLFTSPEIREDPAEAGHHGALRTEVSSHPSPPLKKRPADSSQDSSTEITSAQRPRTQESGGFSIHGSVGQRKQAESPLHLLQTTDSDIPPSQNQRITRSARGEKSKSSENSSSGEGHISPQIPFQTTTDAEQEQAAPVEHASSAEMGSTVMAKWKDDYFYPGKILKIDPNGRFYIRFDDGDQMYVKAKDILLVKVIPIGQSVMVLSSDGYFEYGMVVEYVQQGDRVKYKVSRDEGDTQQCSWSQMILSEGQASCLMSDEEMRVPAAPGTMTSDPRLGDVSLDNLIVGERRRRKRGAQEATPREKEARMTESKGSPAKAPGVVRSSLRGRSASRSTQKEQKDLPPDPPDPPSHGKDKDPPSRGKKRKLQEGPMATSTPTPKAKKPADSTGSVTPTTSGMGGAVDSPSESRGRARRVRVGLFDKSKMGSRPRSPYLFQGIVFLLTHVDKSPEQKLQEKKLLQDSSLETSTEESGTEEEPSIAFDKENLRTNIEAAGGVVLEKYNQAQIEAATQAYLVANTFQRTVKYFQCLAAGIPCVSHQWIIHSCTEGRLLDHKAYILPAGISLERRKLMEWNAGGSCLGGLQVMVASTNVKFQDAWRSILTISRCHLVNRLPVKNKTEDSVNVIVTDSGCPSSVLHQAKQLKIPLVSTEWVIQCLINGHLLGYTSHPQYTHDYQEA
ncbi:TP53-binding protein 1-like isoform X1 [Haliotis rufescens]|uniref:TP53-binding protein 1-like isoform X1 n=2 Tax=Haliotis rufescens TaxID=6454 RepID=UPI00201E78E6|nr:TP53-binding protein 1-like isoform X1 [Haliotis rufescens]